MLDCGDSGSGAPCGTAVSGVKRADRRLIGIGGRHDHRAVGADDRLAADNAVIVGLRSAPSEPAVGGSAHFHPIARAVVVPLGVAVAIERAAGSIVADDPVLVGADAGIVGQYGIPPREAAVGGATGVDPHTLNPARLGQHERRDHPDVILRVVGDGGVGGAIERAAPGVLGQPW